MRPNYLQSRIVTVSILAGPTWRPLVGLLRVALKVSPSSATLSDCVCTVTVCEVSPAGNVTTMEVTAL